MTEDTAGERHVALASSMRRGILRLIADSEGPVDAARVAAECGIHVTTARFHLDQLEAVGLLQREVLHGSVRGRPKVTFRLVPQASDEEPIRELTEVLADALSRDPDGGRSRAEGAGERWSRLYAAETGTDPGEGVKSLTRVFDQLGFAPEVRGEGQDRVLALRGCPFRDAAVAHPEIVCSAHKGLLSGIVTRLGGSPADATLQPFVEPELCLIHLRGSIAAS
jgi:predicted ArsR family transcriptional regulator